MARDLKPLMVGVIAGELLSAIIFMVVGAVYYMWTGDTDCVPLVPALMNRNEKNI